MTALTVAPAPPTARAGALTTTRATAARTLRRFLRTPQLVVVATAQSAMFLLIFRYVFGGAIQTGGTSYVDFLVPGFVATGVLFSAMLSATGVAEDIEGGVFDRFRSLPVPRSALVLGRAVADTAVAGWGLAITSAIGILVGFRLHADLPAGLAALGLCLLFGFAVTWMYIVIGLLAGSAQAAQGLSMIVFPLTFVSSAYVPVATMPSWLQPIAEHQPVTAVVDAVRALVLGDDAVAAGLTQSTTHYVVAALLWCLAIVAVFAPLAVARYRRS